MCNLCDYKASEKSNLKVHVASVHQGIKPFKCKICNYEDAQKKNLKIHIQTVHEEFKPFICNICNYKTAIKSNLKRHLESESHLRFQKELNVTIFHWYEISNG